MGDYDRQHPLAQASLRDEPPDRQSGLDRAMMSRHARRGQAADMRRGLRADDEMGADQQRSGRQRLPRTGRSGGWTVEGVLDVLMRSREDDAIAQIAQVRVVRFQTAYDTWQYDDGRVERSELTGLRGNRAGNVIRLRASLSDEEAASTLFHELHHLTSTEDDYLQQEIDARVATEQFHMRAGMGESVPGYRNDDGTVNEAHIEQQIRGSSHYNPQGRHRIAREYEGEEVVHGWYTPVPP